MLSRQNGGAFGEGKDLTSSRRHDFIAVGAKRGHVGRLICNLTQGQHNLHEYRGDKGKKKKYLPDLEKKKAFNNESKTPTTIPTRSNVNYTTMR